VQHHFQYLIFISNASRRMMVLDEDNNLRLMRADEIDKRGLTPAQLGMKAEQGQVSMEDIRTGSQNLRQSIEALDRPFDIKEIVKLVTAEAQVDGDDDSIFKNVLSTFATQNLTDAQRKFIVDLDQMHERAMLLRLAGMVQVSDILRAAIQRMLPAVAQGDKHMMRKRMDTFDQQVAVLTRGIPKVRVKGVPGSAHHA